MIHKLTSMDDQGISGGSSMEKYAKYVTRVRAKCQFGCGTYGRRMSCPPSSPTPEQTGRVLKSYSHALLIHGDDMDGMNKVVSKLEKKIFFDGFYKAFSMGAGPCELCKECPEVCTHPREARPSMEGSGIDVFGTVRAHGFPIEVLNSKDCKVNLYDLVLIE
jgi:predicted metal-binding protein